jgi:TRAP-type C4-dicarboxylate transport system substrate-binding protein
MKHIGRKAVVSLLAVLALVGFATTEARAAETIKIGTLAPKSSPWGKVFETWIKAVNEKSGGKLELQFFYNGQQGDEDAMVGKMKSGQLDGAAVTGVGLSKVYKPILALQMPGLFTSWSEARQGPRRHEGGVREGREGRGLLHRGLGRRRPRRARCRRASPIKTPDDLKGKKPYYIRADAIQPAVYSVIGGVSGVPLNVPEVLPNLNTGAINVVTSPCLAAEQLQWAGKLDNLNDSPVATAIGALVFSQKRVDALPADLRTILTDTGKVAASALTSKIRSEDDAAFGRLKGKMTVSTSSDAEKTKWAAVFKQARQKLAQGTFSSDLVTKLEGYAK